MVLPAEGRVLLAITPRYATLELDELDELDELEPGLTARTLRLLERQHHTMASGAS